MEHSNSKCAKPRAWFVWFFWVCGIRLVWWLTDWVYRLRADLSPLILHSLLGICLRRVASLVAGIALELALFSAYRGANAWHS